MKSIYLLFFFISFSLNAAIEDDPYKDIVYLKLDNGLQVYLLSDDKAENTQVELTVAVGTDVEDEKTLGLSHLVEHIVFRDKRIPHRDYVDYIKEEGATYMNGYTTRYKTGYNATIRSEKSFWIVEQFARMLFDKQVEIEDLVSEKGAVQTEIGAYEWLDKPLWYLAKTMEALAPPQPDIYKDDFSLDDATTQPAYFNQKINNQTFTLEEVMAHYDAYYYPANMILKVAGNFDVLKMKEHVQMHYGSINKEGTEKAVEPVETPQLNQIPYHLYLEGTSENGGYIGVKYIMDDYMKYLIINAYLDNLALRLQQNLRNDLGHTYSIYASGTNRGKARLAYIYFDGLHDEFETNIIAVREAINDDLESLSDETIDEALREYKKHYTSIEHDSGSLMKLIGTTQYLKEEFDSMDSSFQFFENIDHENFRNVLKETFVDNRQYSVISREYHFFPYDISVLSLLSFVAMIIIYFRLYYFDMTDRKVACAYRDIIMSRRISNRFIGFLYIIAIYYLSALLWEWIKYLVLTYIVGNNAYIYSIDVPYSYIWTISDMVLGILLFLLLCRYLFSYYARLVVTKKGICLIGHRVKTIQNEDIADIKISSWKPNTSFKSFGASILFWKPLLEIILTNGSKVYIRNNNAQHLKEDLEKHLI
ncbi:MAG: insulinase family protein [Methylophaga sp.]|nr:insulinase family protein [Methylophaga sp.]